MSKVAVFGIIIVFVILVGVGIFVYFQFEKPKENAVLHLSDINLLIRNKDKSLLRTQYNVVIDGLMYKNGTSSDNGATVIQVPVNKSVQIYNSNIEKQDFYTSFIDVSTFPPNDNVPLRVNLDLIKPGKLNISVRGNLSDESSKFVFVDLQSDGNINNIGLCLDWSKRMIRVTPTGNFTFTEMTTKPKRLESFYRCYTTSVSLINSNITIILEYKKFEQLTSSDDISIAIFDGDLSPSKSIIYETSLYEDIGMQDVLYDINASQN
jgi:hypothetical protein